MKRRGWMALGLMLGLGILLVFSGCAKKQMVKEEGPGMEEAGPVGSGMEEGEVVTEEIQPIQPKEMKDIYFEFDRFDLSSDARATLADNAAWLQNNPGGTVRIEGNCDERGSNEYNLALGDRRAKSAYNYLINLGVSPSRLSTISYGEEKPQCTEHTESCWQKNRRAHFSAK